MLNQHGITYYFFENKFKVMGIVQLDGDELLCDIIVESLDEVKTIDKNKLMTDYLEKISKHYQHLKSE